MPVRVHVDHDVPQAIARLLRAATDTAGAAKYDVVTARSLSMTAAPDYAHLLSATQHERVLISCNWRDYYLLHGAWHHWSVEWGIQQAYGGILIIAQRLDMETMFTILDAHLLSDQPQRDELHSYDPRYDWRRY